MNYDVFCGVYGASNPGPHAIGIVVIAGTHRNEWAKRLADLHTTTPRAWIAVVDRALVRVDRPNATVLIAVHDQQLVRTLSSVPANDHPAADIARVLLGRPKTSITWIAKRDGHSEMNRAHLLAREAIEGSVAA